MPAHTFKLEWTAENFVVSAYGVGAWTICGGSVFVDAENEAEAVHDCRRLLDSRCEVRVVATPPARPECAFQREQILRRALRRS